MAPLIVEVLAPGLVGAGAMRVAGRSPLTEGPAQGEAGREEAYRLLHLLDRLREAFGERIVVHLIEPLSFAWMLRVLRYRPRRYPVFVVGGRRAVCGLDESAVARTIAALLTPRPAWLRSRHAGLRPGAGPDDEPEEPGPGQEAETPGRRPS
ncbi:MAG: hypothetical protein HY355_07270 [Armatimonadetes bacterium]|nr:hypothetical protein [Armatimonadota bacterium]